MYLYIGVMLLSGTPPITNATVAPAQAPPAADGGLLVNVLDDLSSLTAPTPQQNSQDLTPGAEEGFMKFLTKNNGVLFENDILQIGIKSEYKKNLGTNDNALYVNIATWSMCMCVYV